jgi:Uma2 family endonuclease
MSAFYEADSPPKAARVAENAVFYPDSDGEPMADNTLHYEWIVRIKENLDAMLSDFVAGDHLWYPVEGRPDLRAAPDVMVCLGRPKGYRGSYKQFREEGVAPTVVFEVLSPKNTDRMMMKKGLFYFSYGVREFIVVDPEEDDGYASWKDEKGDMHDVESLDGWTSPALGIRFERTEDGLQVYRPDGSRFLDFREIETLAREAEARAKEADSRAKEADSRAKEADSRAKEADSRAKEADSRAQHEAARAEHEAARAQQEAARAEDATARAERLAARLAALGVSLDEGGS